MEDKEIQQRNKDIALMLGWKESSAHKVDQYGYYQCVEGYSTPYRNDLDEQAIEYQYDENAFAIEDLRFHSDWNWLIESIEFINKIHKENNPYRDLHYTIGYLLHGGWWGDTKIPERLLSDKMQLFLAVSDFAKLYNEGKL
jgi:hypothetical protein